MNVSESFLAVDTSVVLRPTGQSAIEVIYYINGSRSSLFFEPIASIFEKEEVLSLFVV